MLSGHIEYGEDLDLISSIVDYPFIRGEKTADRMHDSLAMLLPMNIEELTVTSDDGSVVLNEGDDYEIDRAAGFLTFPGDKVYHNVTAKYACRDWTTVRGGMGLRGISTDEHGVDIFSQCSIGSFSCNIHMIKPFIYKTQEDKRLHIRSERYKPN